MATPTEALTTIAKLKYLQAEYYRRGIALYEAATFLPGELAVVKQIHKQVDAQATQLITALGASAPARPAQDTTYNFTAGGAGVGPFNPLVLKADFFKLAQLFEDMGVRLIKAQLPSLLSVPASLKLAARIHAVEGRHAAELRMMRGGAATRTMVTNTTTAFQTGVSPWITSTTLVTYDTGAAGYTGVETTPGTQAYVAVLVYGTVWQGADRFTHPTETESNPVQAGYATQAEAFDEPIPAASATEFFSLFGVTL